jgi:hypothetical protein
MNTNNTSTLPDRYLYTQNILTSISLTALEGNRHISYEWLPSISQFKVYWAKDYLPTTSSDYATVSIDYDNLTFVTIDIETEETLLLSIDHLMRKLDEEDEKEEPQTETDFPLSTSRSTNTNVESTI